MLKIKLLFACLLLAFSFARAQYETHLLSYTTLCISTSDMDGDGDIDILSGGLNNLQWQENLGNAVFYSHTITQLQSEVHAAIAVDIDKDGDMDVITASYLNNSIYWMKNDGNQNFTASVITTIVSGAVSIDVKDVDDDGHSDIVCAAFLGDAIFWLQNNGNQVFTLLPLLSNFDGAISVAAADIDNDGDMDIAAAAQLDSTFLWLENDGNEQFTSHVLTSSINSPYKISFSNVDNDTDLDILYASSGGCGWYANNAAVFTKNAITTGDFRDLLFTDVDNDGDKDPVYLSYLNDYVTWAKNNGNLTFVAGGFLDQSFDRGTMLSAADLNADGKMDIVAASGFEVKTYMNGASQIFTKNLLNRYLSDANYACHGDFDNDGDIDLMAVGYFNINFYRNDGGGIFTTKPVFPTTVSFAGRQIRAADMDGDGDMDAVYTESVGNLVSWIENQGGGVFVKRNVASIIDPYAVYPIDFDFDGDMDVLTSRVQSTSTSAVFWYENDGSENYTQHLVDAAYHYGVDLFPVDYNTDGYMDVIGAYSGLGGSQKIVLHYNSASGFNNTNYVLNANAPGVNSIFAIDLDADSDMDVLSANYTNNTIIWYENPGQVQHVIDNNAQGATYVYAADLDNDGDLDVASTSRTDNEINWYSNNGNQSFTKQNIAQNVPDPEVILACDLDSDNVLELYSTCSSSESVAYYKLPPPPAPLVLSDCNELFFSEYMEGSSFNKAIEIYNPTTDTIDLTGYQINVHSSGNIGVNQSLNLAGKIAPFTVFLAAHSSSIPGILNKADTLFGFSFNGDDAIVLKKNGAIIDIIGKIGEDPGTAWNVGGVSTLNSTLVRKPAAAKGNNLNPAFDPSLQWISYSTDDTTHLGNHISLCTTYCPPSITILASQDSICPNTLVTFSSSSVNEGTSPSYQWKKNGVAVGNNSSTYSDNTLLNNDTITCVMTSNASCVITPDVTSNSVIIKVSSGVIPTVVITSNSFVYCEGTLVTIVAAVTNGGASPSYQWKVNNMNVGTDTAYYSDSLFTNLDVISCTITSNATCILNSTANSNLITLTINPIVTPSLSIQNNVSAVCYGSGVNFTSTVLNGGTSPIYQWTLNGNAIAGANSANYLFYPISDSSQVSLSIISNASCLSTASAQSDSVLITILPVYSPDISITVSQDSICSGTLVNFTGIPINEGPSPVYIWRKNLGIVGSNSPNYSTNLLLNGDVVSLQMTGSLPCSNTTAVSNDITMTVSTALNAPTIIQSGNTLIASFIPGVTYQWFDCNNGNLPIAGATNQNFSPLVNGNYGVSVQNLLCANSSVACINFIAASKGDLNEIGKIAISPNPGNGIFTLVFPDNATKLIEVKDAIGRTIYYTKHTNTNTSYTLDLTAFAKGLYILTIRTGDENYVRRIVIE